MSTNCTFLRCLLKSRILKRKSGGKYKLWILLEFPLNKSSHHVIFFAINSTMNIVERLSPQSSAAGAANEAIGVIEISHCLTRLTSSSHFISASVTNTLRTQPFSLEGNAWGNQFTKDSHQNIRLVPHSSPFPPQVVAWAPQFCAQPQLGQFLEVGSHCKEEGSSTDLWLVGKIVTKVHCKIICLFFLLGKKITN